MVALWLLLAAIAFAAFTVGNGASVPRRVRIQGKRFVEAATNQTIVLAGQFSVALPRKNDALSKYGAKLSPTCTLTCYNVILSLQDPMLW